MITSTLATLVLKRCVILGAICSGHNTVPKLCELTGMKKRGIETIIGSFGEHGVILVRDGSNKTGCYRIDSFGVYQSGVIKANWKQWNQELTRRANDSRG